MTKKQRRQFSTMCSQSMNDITKPLNCLQKQPMPCCQISQKFRVLLKLESALSPITRTAVMAPRNTLLLKRFLSGVEPALGGPWRYLGCEQKWVINVAYTTVLYKRYQSVSREVICITMLISVIIVDQTLGEVTFDHLYRVTLEKKGFAH